MGVKHTRKMVVNSVLNLIGYRMAYVGWTIVRWHRLENALNARILTLTDWVSVC